MAPPTATVVQSQPAADVTSKVIPKDTSKTTTASAAQTAAQTGDQAAPGNTDTAAASASHSSRTRNAAQNAASSTAVASNVAVNSHGSSKSSNTGLIAGVVVLAVLLAIALAVIAFLALRNKRKGKSARPNKYDKYEPSYEQKTPLDPSSAIGLETLQGDLKSRDEKIRELQAALLKKGRGVTDLDDRKIRDRFTALSQNINDWVMTYFKGQNFHSPTSARTIGLLQKVAPDYGTFLQDPRMKYLVFRAIVIENITEAIAANQFIGNIPFNELQHGFNRNAPAEKVDEWRALTVSLLQTIPDQSREKASAVQDVAARIDSMTTEIARGISASGTRSRSLQVIVDNASELAMDLGKQQAAYVIGSDQVGVAFDAESMEDVSQTQTGRGRPVQAIVFPSLKKVIQPGGQSTVVSKAQVVI